MPLAFSLPSCCLSSSAVTSHHTFLETAHCSSTSSTSSTSSFSHLLLRRPFLAVLQMHRVLRIGGHMLLMMPSTYPYHFGPWDFWRVSPDSLKVLASPFASVAMCGSHRSVAIATLLAQPDSKKAIKIYPARDAKARRMVLEAPRAKSASRPRWGWDGDRIAPSGEPKYGESIVSSWIMAVR